MLSFDITDRNIRIIKGIENKNKISISSAATLNVDEDIIVNGHVKDVPRLATLMNQKIKQNKMSDKEAIVSISSNMTIFKELNVRRTAKEQEFTKNVKAEMQAKVGIDDSYAISYSIVEGSSNDADMVTVLATACPTEVIDSYKRVFSMLGISLRSVIIGCNCITKFLLSDDKNRSKMPLLAVQIDNNFISLNIYENSQLSFSRFASIDAADYDNSADYVYEAVNENIFRMLQFHKSKGTGESIRNVILYGETKEFVRIQRDLEQMDINTSVIAVPKNVKGYQNLEVPLYANAIGAMFSRNKATEKINLLEFGGATAAISDRVNSDRTFWPVFAAVSLGVLVIMGGITAYYKIKDSSIVKKTEEMVAFNESSETKAKLELREQRLAMKDEVKKYQNMASLAYDALRSRPYVESELYSVVEKTLKDTIKELDTAENKNETAGVEYKLDDLAAWEQAFKTENYTAFAGNNVSISNFSYENGQLTFEYTMYAGSRPSPTFSSKFTENLLKTGYFANVQNNGYTLNPENEVKKYGQVNLPNNTTITQEGDTTKARCFTSAVILDVKSPIDANEMVAYGDEAAEEDK